MMHRRYEAYRDVVVRPFFRDHFALLDRQIVLVDALSALNSGPAAVRDLEAAMGDVLRAFRTGQSGLISRIFRPRIDRILFAATKAEGAETRPEGIGRFCVRNISASPSRSYHWFRAAVPLAMRNVPIIAWSSCIHVQPGAMRVPNTKPIPMLIRMNIVIRGLVSSRKRLH